MAKKQKLVLLDSYALIHRAYHALPPMTADDGMPTNAVYGFTTMLLKVLSSVKPTHVAAAFDLAGPTFRHEEFADYKAHRAKPDEDLIVQFDLVRAVVRAFNIPIFEKEGFEADDVIGTVADQAADSVPVVIVTGDMDALQLVDDRVSVLTPGRGPTQTVMYDEAAVQEQFGFTPALLADYKGLRGDPSDNIPGVAGVGDKTAKELVSRYGSIEDIYTHLEELPARAKGRLAGQREAALQSRRLATIRRDVPVQFDLAAAAVHDFDPAAVRAVFGRLGFRSLLTKIPKSTRPVPADATVRQGGLALPRRSLLGPHEAVTTAAGRRELARELLQATVIAVDTETDFLGARVAPIVGVSFAAFTNSHPRPLSVQGEGKMRAWYAPVTRESVKEFKALLENPKVGKTGHNLKYDAEVLQQSGITLAGIVFDSMIGSYLLKPGARTHSLATVAAEELGYSCIPIEDLIGKGKDQKKMSDVPLESIAPYASEDALAALRLYEELSPRIQDVGLARVLNELELPLIPVLAHIELAGVQIDTEVLAALAKQARREAEMLTYKIQQLAREEFNVSSTQQLRRVLYEKLRLPTAGIARGQTGYSTAASELAKLHGQHEIIELIERYRELTKLISTYLETLPQQVDVTTGRLYASFHQTVAATGRLSSSGSNLQNIPVRTKMGRNIRAAFTAARGRRLVKADYSQLELRIAAHLAQDEQMLAAFRAGEDIHRATAAWVYGAERAAVTDEQRRTAKTLNFGVLYGMGPQKFARESGVSMEEARSFIERYWQHYAGLAKFKEEVIRQAEELGFVETLFGRRLPVPDIRARNPQVRAAAERAAFNFPIQGTEADILKKAMVELYAIMQRDWPEARMVLTVHDELVVEVLVHEMAAFAAVMRQTMEGAAALDVSLAVEVAAGKNWRDMAPVDSGI
ncbi:MAG: DNA polymerase I [Candidatus Andersenbacteria bacterium CG10_big_fil_rev_8_21_14_0_10_54_11]|uniref:DNA polymerase I n=1 Tax=Candidatus Andersenbacteria bacterium CG10_big_fil_rev_8_21_14_0_10_54_11 TaxID=1974485 RepID=A0A2M6WYC9_9BACT|nr:MAG: DNA polymerase I [Candidatus Andersenbacteria bacterium CG10_big_fil_rev_8_21_14_0_10_54_11]